ncbi:DUF1353 domain-containing protein [Nocardioides sp.]|uniref:DUF1353 domain-containing protein n=1 Tax=Nocardioides sp. TaxID=35761 RepID=UPI00352953EC
MELTTTPDPGNFSYGEPMDEAERRRTWPHTPDNVMLWRMLTDRGKEEFALLATISYYDEEHQRTITVPDVFSEYTTDLTSVPSWFTWLVPKSGTHLPAALVHDGLVCDPDQNPTYRLDPPGEPLDRIDADVVFRNAMRDAHVGLVRRWLVWAAVTTASLWQGPRRVWPARNKVYYRAVIALLVGTIAYLGACATAQVFDRGYPWAWTLPWIPEGSWWSEIGYGLAGAIVIPSVLALAWGKYARAGLIVGIALAALFHVTLAIAVLGLAYQGLEWLVARAVRAGIGWTLLVAAAVGWLVALTMFVLALG